MVGNAMNEFLFYNPTKLLFGTGKLGELHEQMLPGKKAFLLTSAGQSIYKNGAAFHGTRYERISQKF